MTVNLTEDQLKRLQANLTTTPQDATGTPTKPAKARKEPRQAIIRLLEGEVWGYTPLGSKSHLWRRYGDGVRYLARCGRECSYPGWQGPQGEVDNPCPMCAGEDEGK